MHFTPFDLVSLLGLAALASGSPTPSRAGDMTLSRRGGLSCATLAAGLSATDCAHLSAIGFAGQGANAGGADKGASMWVGASGPNQFVFTNRGDGPVTVVMWDFPPGAYVSSFMSAVAPQIAYSLARPGDSVTVGVANGVSGGWAAVHAGRTALSPWGQVDNTWGEFTTGQWATVDVSREVNMRGNAMSVRVGDDGCVSDMNVCSFQCVDPNAKTCGDAGTYKLVNCDANSQPGASTGLDAGQASGGCQGWSNGGTLHIALGK